ncbi:hypothetical protein ACFWQC_03070 [Nocardioides sp. NPDC058538]|uniref:hypothetical protein n=1 Tax=Nocardioides sp. NPDC058538 TaxID=3346542 RepID=UPI00365AF8AB
MDRVIDLDLAAVVLVERLAGRPDLQPSPITWNGFEAAFDEPFKTRRDEVVDPYSVGVAIRRGEEEGLRVLYAGSWTDMEYWSGDVADDVDLRVPGWDDWLDLPRFDAVMAEFLSLFRVIT